MPNWGNAWVDFTQSPLGALDASISCTTAACVEPWVGTGSVLGKGLKEQYTSALHIPELESSRAHSSSDSHPWATPFLWWARVGPTRGSCGCGLPGGQSTQGALLYPCHPTLTLPASVATWVLLSCKASFPMVGLSGWAGLSRCGGDTALEVLGLGCSLGLGAKGNSVSSSDSNLMIFREHCVWQDFLLVGEAALETCMVRSHRPRLGIRGPEAISSLIVSVLGIELRTLCISASALPWSYILSPSIFNYETRS